jgi:hypothetical protein
MKEEKKDIEKKLVDTSEEKPIEPVKIPRRSLRGKIINDETTMALKKEFISLQRIKFDWFQNVLETIITKIPPGEYTSKELSSEIKNILKAPGFDIGQTYHQNYILYLWRRGVLTRIGRARWCKNVATIGVTKDV